MSISGDYAVVGACEKDDVGIDSGSVYIFVRSGTTWTQQQKLTASDADQFDYFGYSVSVSEDYAVVGANGDNSLKGSAYIFVRSGTTWTQQQKLTASDAASDGWFGSSVSISSDYAVVGARGDNSRAQRVHLRSLWDDLDATTKTHGLRCGPIRLFGISVSISGDYAVLGAPSIAPFDNSTAGSAYIFVRSGTTWTQQQKLTASDAASGDNFGRSVSVSGDYAVVGAPRDNSDTGSVHLRFALGRPGRNNKNSPPRMRTNLTILAKACPSLGTTP